MNGNPPGDTSALRVGIDVVSIRRLAELQDHTAFLERAFVAAELNSVWSHAMRRGNIHRAAEYLAGLLAVKEAVAKASGVLPPPWLEIAVSRGAFGRPEVRLSPALAHRIDVLDVSVSHDGGVAAAVVLVRHSMGGHTRADDAPGDAPRSPRTR